MARLDNLKQKVSTLYEQKLEGRDNWSDWLYEYHVALVAQHAKELAERFGANAELAEAAAWLHDVADYKMQRSDSRHEEESLAIARDLMKQCGYSQADIELVVDDAIRLHSCHDDQRPKSKEGLILATADSLAHLKTDFYIHGAWGFGQEGETFEDTKAWVLKKIERDLNNKISFPEVRKEARPDCELLKALFSR